MCCLTIVFMCVKIEASCVISHWKCLSHQAGLLYTIFSINFFLETCIHKTWNFTLVLLIKVLLMKTTFTLYKANICWTCATFPCHFKLSTRMTYYFSFLVYHCMTSIRISPYSVRMQENTDQNNYEYGHFLRSVFFQKL